jgi:hypothetical protein
VHRAKLPAPVTDADRDRARLAVASAARDAADAVILLAALGLDQADDIADHLTRRRTAATQTGDPR